MSRFRQAGSEPAYSEIKPERCPREHPGERERAERRRAYMEEIPTPDELAGEQIYSQLRGNKWR